MHKFVILNHFDKPYERHVCQVLDNGDVFYIHRSLRYWEKMGLQKESTPLEAFGFTWDIEDTGLITFIRPADFVTQARYSDGKPRLWQGEDFFQLYAWCENRRERA